MATQVRCDKCGRLSAASDLRYTAAEGLKALHVLLWLVAIAFVVCIFMWRFVP
jgi:hypothetical protein